MNKLRVLVLVPIVLILLNGCATVFEHLIPKASGSRAADPEIVCVQFVNLKPEALPAVAAMLAPIVLGFAVDQVAKGLEAESKPYKASYSGRATAFLLELGDGHTTQRQREIRIDRYHGDTSKKHGCPGPQTTRAMGEAISQERVASFQGDIEWNPEMNAVRIVPTLFEFRKAKAKVSYFRRKVDVNVQVTLTTFVRDREGVVKQADIAQVDIPLGKLKLPDGDDFLILNETALKQLRSGWYPLPVPRAADDAKPAPPRGAPPQPSRPAPPPATGNSPAAPVLTPPAAAPRTVHPIMPINLTITVMESDDFGDVIAKGAKLVSDNKEKIVSEALKALGLKGDEKDKDKK